MTHALAFLGGGVLHPLGYCAGTHAAVVACRGYNLWSGIVSDIGEVTLITAVLVGFYGAYRKHKCGHCWRPARHHVTVHADAADATSIGWHAQGGAAHSTTYPSCHKHLDHNHALAARAK